jgi:hypothetical protein
LLTLVLRLSLSLCFCCCAGRHPALPSLLVCLLLLLLPPRSVQWVESLTKQLLMLSLPR